MKIKIITDTGCDLPYSYIKENQIELVPFHVELDGKEYRDMIDIQARDIYNAMRNGKTPKTSQASPNTLKESFIKIAKKNQTGIYIAFSSELSGTYHTACMVREQVMEEYPELDLTIIDSRSASLGQGLCVRNAVELAKKGANKEEIIKKIEYYRDHIEHIFTVDDLEYLRRGGRLSRAGAFIGSLLSIKPLLHVEDGKLVPLEKVRGRKKVLNRFLEIMDERCEELENQLIGISHGDDEETALTLKEMIEDRFGCKHFFIHTIGAAIGAHSGPGTLAVFFLNRLE